MKIILFLVAIVFSTCCCSRKGDGSVSEVIVNGNKMYVSSLNDLKADTVTIALSSVVENLELVHLETKKEAYFKPWYTTVTEKYIGVRQQDGRPYMLFDRSGIFLCTVGSKGRGPGEYVFSPNDDIIDDKNELIYLAPFMDDKILVYNTSGQFLKNIVAPYRLNKAKIFLSDNVLTVVHMPLQNDKSVAFQIDVNTGKVLNELSTPEHLIVQSFDAEIWNTKNMTGIFDFRSTQCDTLYHFDVKNNKMLPFFLMTYVSSENPYKLHYHLNKDIIVTYIFGKKGTVVTDLKNKTSSWTKVVNDFCGNINAYLAITMLSNGYFVHNLQPEELMEMIENRLAERSCTAQDRQILNKTLSTLKENANNVVFIGKLKSEVKSKLW